MHLIKKALIPIVLVAILPWAGSSDTPPAPTPKTPTVMGTAPFGALTEAELDYYGKSFSYALETLKEGQVYDWRTKDSEGQILMGKIFKNQHGQPCRGFSEIYTIQNVTGKHTGYGCKRDGRDGWCKLKQGNMMSCAFEPADGWIDQIAEGIDAAGNKAGMVGTNVQGNVNNANNNGGSVGGVVGGTINSIGSSVGGAGVGSVTVPEVSDEMKEDAKPSNAVKWWR